ncbi:MAG: Gfo/Idh/MocA family protein [Parvularcula sp.]
MEKKLRAGVAGAGVFGGYHANKYLEVTGADLAAIFDVDQARATEAAETRQVAAFTDYDTFLDEIDILTIATPASTHGDLAMRALEAGKHVLVEKPIAMSVDVANQLIDAAKERNLVLQVGHQERYVADAFGLLTREAPRHVRSRRLNRFSGRAMDVSVVFDLMIHDLDLLAQYADLGTARIDRIEAHREHGEKADHVEVSLSFPTGMTASLAASRTQETPLRDLLLEFDGGEVGLDFLNRLTRNTTAAPLAVSFDSEEKPPALADPLRFGTQSFVDAVHGKTDVAVSGGAGRAALGLALEIEAAAIAEME